MNEYRTKARTSILDCSMVEFRNIEADANGMLTPEAFKRKYGYTRETAKKWITKRKNMNNPPEKDSSGATRVPLPIVSPGSKDFFVNDISDKPNIITRNFQIYETTFERLQKLLEAKQQYKTSAVINQLLSDALDLYGY